MLTVAVTRTHVKGQVAPGVCNVVWNKKSLGIIKDQIWNQHIRSQNIRNYCVFELCPSSIILENNSEYNFPETGSVTVLRYQGDIHVYCAGSVCQSLDNFC
jgi:hypothetical protein